MWNVEQSYVTEDQRARQEWERSARVREKSSVVRVPPMRQERRAMTFVRFLFTYMFVVTGVEGLLLVGGLRSDRDFFVGASAALAGTIAWYILSAGRKRVASMVTARRRQTEINRSLRPRASRGPTSAVLHGSSPWR